MAYGATVRVPVYEGHHVLRVRCRPMSGGQLTMEVAPSQTQRLLIYVGLFHEVCIRADDRDTSNVPT